MRVVRLVDEYCPYKIGDEGVVLQDGSIVPPVRMDGYKKAFHDCLGLCESGHGYFIEQEKLELVEEVEPELTLSDKLEKGLITEEEFVMEYAETKQGDFNFITDVIDGFAQDWESHKSLIEHLIREYNRFGRLSPRPDLVLVEEDKTTAVPTKDRTDAPSYYIGKYKGIEAMDVVLDFQRDSYNLGVAIAYLLRAGKKEGNPMEQDIQKAIDHLHAELNLIQKL